MQLINSKMKFQMSRIQVRDRKWIWSQWNSCWINWWGWKRRKNDIDIDIDIIIVVLIMKYRKYYRWL